MSQVSLLFKDRILSVHHLDQYNDFIIGHAPDCHIHIDSLAVKSHHAKILYDDHAYTIEPLESEADILINNKNIESSVHLSDGDHISLGKHTLLFSFDERNESNEFREPEPEPVPVSVNRHVTGWIQYLNGQQMGTTVQIKKNMTHISDKNAQNVALISNRSDGFYISHLKGKHSPKINNVSIGEKSTKLSSNNRISLGSLEILFYID